MQQFNVSLTVPVPEDMILISKIEFEHLKEQTVIGVYWKMRDLEKHTGKKIDWIKENILYPSRFKKILDVNNGGFVYYPEKKGQTWVFQASKMTKFLENNFYMIFGKG